MIVEWMYPGARPVGRANRFIRPPGSPHYGGV